MRAAPTLRAYDGGLAPAARQVDIDESALPRLSFETRADSWRAAVLASVGEALVSPAGRLKTAALGVHVERPILSSNAGQPEIHLLQEVTTTAAELVCLSSLHDHQEPGLATVGTNVYYEMPGDGDEWSVRQYALWFEPQVMDGLTHPRERGVVVAGPGQRWEVRQSRPGPDGDPQDHISTSVLDAVATLRLGSRIGFVENEPGGRIAVRFNDGPGPNGRPVPFREIVFQGWQPKTRQPQPLAALDVQHNLASGSGGLWIIVTHAPGCDPIGAVLCFPYEFPDDCERAPSGDALIHPLAEVLL